MPIPEWVTAMRQQWDSWAQQQRAAFNQGGWPPWHWKPKLPWQEDQKRKEELQEEYRKRKTQIQDLCQALKAEDTEDLQDLLGALVLAECVYKRPEAEMVRAVNSLRADFGGQLVPLYRVQATLDHVPHRYLLAEGGDTLFAAFAGTKQYRDFVTDANILQGAMFNDENESELKELKEEDVELATGSENDTSSLSNVKPKLTGLKPAAHRGFLARAKGIPAVELYRLAQKKDRKLVLCGHSLGGAVAVLTTLAILRVFATASVTKAGGKLQIKCITFSQPPVGNRALRDYVNQNGWQDHFRTYCIPEDVIPRILSPAYFEHYRSQVAKRISEVVSGPANGLEASAKDSASPVVGKGAGNPSSNDSENNNNKMILGVGPIPKHLWRLPKLVPINGPLKPFQWFKDRGGDRAAEPSEGSKQDSKVLVAPLDIQQENGESVAQTPALPASDMKENCSEGNEVLSSGSNDDEGKKAETLEGNSLGSTLSVQESKEGQSGNGSEWLKRAPSVSVPSLPSYVPFGKLFFLERMFVTPLSASEYTELNSVQSVFQELKARFRSHTMRSYRGRFVRIFSSCMSDGPSTSWNIEHLSHLPNLQSWLGILGARVVEAGNIADSMALRTATSIVPLGWNGLPGDKPEKSLFVDVHGYGLHHCTRVRAQVNGHWCSTSVDVLPPRAFPDHELQQVQPKLQKMRVRIGPPVDNGPEKAPDTNDGQGASVESSSQTSLQSLSEIIELTKVGNKDLGLCDGKGLGEVTIECSTDFMTTSQDVAARLRRVRLLGLEGAGKTSLYFALLGGDGRTTNTSDGDVLPDMDMREGIANGVNYVDGAGVNLQDLAHETEQLRQEVRVSGGKSGKKLDLIILVHNLAHKVPRLHGGDARPQRPALGVLLDEISAAGIPVVLAITNKFAVSADRRHLAASSIMNSYRVPSNLTVVVNSCPYSVHGLSNESLDALAPELESKSKGPVANGIVQGAAQRLFFGPMKLVPRPFGRREVILPVEGVNKLNSLVQSILSSNEEAAFEDHAKDQLALQVAEEMVQRAKGSAGFGIGKPGAAGAAAVGAAFGAGFGVVVAVVIGASKALRKP